MTCPSDLKGAVGTTLRCTLTDSGETYAAEIAPPIVVSIPPEPLWLLVHASVEHRGYSD